LHYQHKLYIAEKYRPGAMKCSDLYYVDTS